MKTYLKTLLRKHPKDKKQTEREQEIEQKTKERLYVEYLLFRLWFQNKNANGTYEFEPVNIRTGNNPYYVDALKFDTSETSESNAALFASTASNDKLLLRGWSEKVAKKFGNSTCYKTYELNRLVNALIISPE